MIQRIYRIIFLLFLAAGTIRLSAQAQSSDIGVWIVDSELEQTSLADEDGQVTIDFDEELGFGISFNHFWTDRFSTELAAQTIRGDVNLNIDTIESDLAFHGGDFDATTITAMGQLHFRRATRFAPYVGAGLAYVWGEFDPTDFPDDEPGAGDPLDLEAEITWAAAVGANVRITDSVYFVGEMKYIPWEAIAEDDPARDELDVNPMTFAAGVKVRF